MKPVRPDQPYTLKRLRRMVLSPFPSRTLEACEALRKMPTEEFAELLVEINSRVRSRKKQVLIFLRLPIAAVILAFCALAGAGYAEYAFGPTVVCLIAAASAPSAAVSVDETLQSHMVSALQAHASAPSLLPTILELLSQTEWSMAYRKALSTALRAMPDTSLDLITRKYRERLNRILGDPYSDVALTIRIIEIFKLTAGSEVVSSLQRLSNEPAIAGNMVMVRNAARACLPVVLERTRKELAGKGLLRASIAPQESGDELLRSDLADSPTAADELLRQAADPASGVVRRAGDANEK